VTDIIEIQKKDVTTCLKSEESPRKKLIPPKKNFKTFDKNGKKIA
jgi:hypothetical protein